MSCLRDTVIELVGNEVSIRETCAECTIECVGVSEVVEIGVLVDFAKSLPPGDCFALRVEFTDEDFSSTALDVYSEDEALLSLLRKIEETVDAGYSYSISLSIRKELTVQGDEYVYRIYDLERFEHYFFNLDFATQILLFSDYCKRIPLPRLRIIAPYDNAEIVLGATSCESRREELIRKRKSICDIQGEELHVTPDDLHLLYFSGIDPLALSRLQSLESAVSLMYLASSSILDGRSVKLNLRGVAETFDPTCSIEREHLQSACELFTWVYEGGDVFDKREIAHNVAISRNRQSPLLELDQSALNAIHSSYVFYLRENIADYLRSRDNLAQSITEQCERISEGVTSYIADLKGAYLILLGDLLSAVLLKHQGSFGVNGEGDLLVRWAPWIILLVITAVGVFLYTFECRRSEYQKRQLDSLKVENSDLLHPDEIERFFEVNGRVKAAEKFFGLWSKIFLLGWLISCVAVGVVIAIFWAA